MRRFLLFVAAIVLAAVLYSVFSDPEKKENFLGTIEGSTGVDLDAEPRDVLEDAGRAVGGAAEQLFRDLGDTLTDPEFHRSVEKWGRDALDKLDDADLGRLKRDLEREAAGSRGDYDAIFEKYLGEADNS